jgi:hypothetical protein
LNTPQRGLRSSVPLDTLAVHPLNSRRETPPPEPRESIDARPGGNMNAVERVRNILVNPKGEWPKIAAEPASVQSLYVGYILILAAIGPIAVVLRSLAFGFGLGIPVAVAMYVITLVTTFIVALIVDAIAPMFGGEKNIVGSLKLVAYSLTAAWIAGIFRLVPYIGGIIGLIAAVYSIYTFYLGVPPVKKSPEDKAMGYTVVVLICYILLIAVLGLVLFPIMTGGDMIMSTMGMFR